MPYPSPPEIQTSYTAHEQALGDGSLPGQELDVDLAAIRASLTATIDFLKGIARSDGKLTNGSVTLDALGTAIVIGFDPPAPWATGTDYTTRSIVFESLKIYLCLVDHTSTVFATDLSASRWTELADLTPPGGALLASNNLSDVADAANARGNLGLGTLATANSGTGAAQYRTNAQNEALFQPTDPNLVSVAGLPNFSAPVLSLLGSADAAAAQSALGLGSLATRSDITTAQIAADTLVTSLESFTGLSSDARVPTVSAVRDHVSSENRLEFMNIFTADGSGPVDVTGITPGPLNRRRFLITLDRFKPSADNVYLLLRTSTDGTNFDSGAGNYAWSLNGSTAGTVITDGSDSSGLIALTPPSLGIGNAANEYGVSGEIWIMNVTSGGYTEIQWSLGYWRETGTFARVTGGAARLATTSVIAVRLNHLSGVPASGTARLYGLR